MAKVIKKKSELKKLEKGVYYITPPEPFYISSDLVDALIDIDSSEPYTLCIGEKEMRISIDEEGRDILVIE